MYLQKLGVQGAGLKKNAKTPRNGGVEKVVRSSVRNQRSTLSQSLSFSSKGILGNDLRRSVDAISHSRPNDSEAVSNVSHSTNRALQKSSRSISSVVSSSDAKKDGVLSQRSPFISGPGFRHSVVTISI